MAGIKSCSVALGLVLSAILIAGTVAAVSECGGQLCIHGTCSGSTCTCDTGYVGPQCGTSEDDCASNPCAAGSTCVDGHQTHSCACASGYEGADCGISTGCKKASCQQGSTCVPIGSDFACDCPTGYSGKQCESPTESLTINHKIGVTSSSSAYGGEPKDAVDGVKNNNEESNSCAQTSSNDLNPFWAVHFDDIYPIRHVRVHNYNGYGHYFRFITVYIDGTAEATWDATGAWDDTTDIHFPEGTMGRNVTISKQNENWLLLCEVEVWGYTHS